MKDEKLDGLTPKLAYSHRLRKLETKQGGLLSKVLRTKRGRFMSICIFFYSKLKYERGFQGHVSAGGEVTAPEKYENVLCNTEDDRE